MKCENKNCGKDFDPTEEATIGHPDGEALQVETQCTHCKARYFAFVDEVEWVIDK